jgi:branched-chain amino acid transport system ATP-binding protein
MSRPAPTLRVAALRAGYGRNEVLHDVALGLPGGEVGLVIGPNGAGKSTILKAIFGLCRVLAGEIWVDGVPLAGRTPQDALAAGVGLVPQGGRAFPNLTVEENLKLGGYTLADRGAVEARLPPVYEMFPRLAERRRQPAQTLSGGERQMLALGRALVMRPRLLLLDEPSLGLAPAAVDQMLALTRHVRRVFGATVLLVEQNVLGGLRVADRVFVLREGRTVAEAKPADLLASDELRRAFLSV